jgi:hypothetical protein
MKAPQAVSPEGIKAMLERVGLDPSRVDLEWLARIKHDTELKIAEQKSTPEFAAALAVSVVPPSR